MTRSLHAQLKALGLSDEMIARTTVDGKPLAEVDKPKESKLPKGMNKTEALYAAELDWLLRDGTIKAYWFESVKLKLAHNTHYTPDFLVQFPDGRLRFVEIKGFLREDASIKFKLAREKFPWAEWVMLRRVKGKWAEVKI